MPLSLTDARRELALANRILAHEGVLDAFGHVSMRHPARPDRFLLSRYSAAALVTPRDILEFTLDAEPAAPTKHRFYSERVIHGEIYRARADVQAVVHHHAMAVLPFCASDAKLVPLYHLGAAALSGRVPLWDSRDEFDDTALVVTTHAQARSLARALGADWIVLMRRHGATVGGRDLREAVFRAIYMTRNAELQWKAQSLGTLAPLSDGEAALCAEHNLGAGPVGRAWDYWVRRLEDAETVIAAAKRKRR